MQFYCMIAESDFARFSANDEEFASRGKKISSMSDISLTASLGEFLIKISPHTRGNSRANCLAMHFAQLLLNSFLTRAAGFKSLT